MTPKKNAIGRGRPRLCSEDLVSVAVRMQPDLVAHIDRERAAMRAEGVEAGRSDAIRRALLRYFVSAAAPTRTEVLEVVRACRHQDSGLAEVPAVVRQLWRSGRPLEAVHAALLEADRGGELELRPESGMGRLSAADAVLCPQGNRGVPLSWCRIRESTTSKGKKGK